MRRPIIDMSPDERTSHARDRRIEKTEGRKELCWNLCDGRSRTAALRASSPVMLATRTIRSSRPAASGAGRLLAHLAFVIAMVIGTVFAHGGACAAVELAEPTGHSTGVPTSHHTGVRAGHNTGVRAEEPVGDTHSAVCLHRNLPPRHQHGTEQDCSAIGPAAPPAPSAMQETTVSPPRTCAGPLPVVRGAQPLPGAPPGNSCVMRT
ncbi:hypothetical protein ACIBI7_31290 [Nonomuraea fuscirosea]|uniref:hypothetical protein n=1 Tax=Nonomuraea fuscirosea TaxID=1291556 RepID=UPI0037BD1D7A